MLLKDIEDPEVFLALKKVCIYLVNDVWQTTGDLDFDRAVEDTTRYKDDVEQLLVLDGDLGWGDVKTETGSNSWHIKHKGNFNPWYSGSLKLEDFLDCLGPLVECLGTANNRHPDVEFLHYYEFLRGKLPKRPQSQPASITLDKLHPKILAHCRGRFKDSHYEDAIFAAYKVVLNEIKDVTDRHDIDGEPLVMWAFSPGNPAIKFNKMATKSDQDEQRGLMYMFAGAVAAIRNPKAHDLVVQEDEERTLYYLALASLLMDRLDERIE